MNKNELQKDQAKIMAASQLVPDHYRNQPANCLMAIQAAESLGCDPLFFAQNTYLMKGKPAMTAKLQIAAANLSKRIKGGIRWVVKDGDYWCEATEEETGETLVGPVVNMGLAQAEGWTRNRKYQTLPDLMLRYRAAAFFISMYLPDATMGFRTVEEVEDIVAAEAPGVEEAIENLPPELGGPQPEAVAVPESTEAAQY